jgi:hypothetical protein
MRDRIESISPAAQIATLAGVCICGGGRKEEHHMQPASRNVIEALETRRLFSVIVQPLGNGNAAVSVSISSDEFQLLLPPTATPPSPIAPGDPAFPTDPCLPGLLRAAGGEIIPPGE